MKKKITPVFLFILTFLTVVSCNDVNVDAEKDASELKRTSQVTKQDIQKAKERNGIPADKKGIELMAEYHAQIRKPIGAEKSNYEKGYLLEELKKAKARAKNRTGSRTPTATFTERGPNNVPGRSRAILVHPTNDNVWFVGTAGGGVWTTTDAGTTWANLTDNQIPNLSTSTLALCESVPNTMYAGSGEPFGNLDAIGGSGVFKTTDGGTTWAQLANTETFGDVGRIVVDPNDADHVVMGTDSGIYLSTNGGTTWSQTYANGNVQDLDATPGNFDVMYGSANGVGIVKSTDGGATWSLVFDVSVVNSGISRIETGVSAVDPDVVVLCAYAPGAAAQSTDTDLFISRDAGATFTNLTSTGTEDRKNLVGGQGWYDNIVLNHPFDENIFYVGGVELFKVTVNPADNSFAAVEMAATQQNGNLNQVNTNVHVDQHGLAYIEDSATTFRLILAGDGGIHTATSATDPGVANNTWTSAVSGKNSTQFYGADKRNGTIDYVGGAQDNGSWVTLANNTTATSNYISALGGDGFEAIWHYNNPNDFIVSSQFNNIVTYFNLGASFGTFPQAGNGPFYSKVANANNNPDAVFAVNSSGVWRSTDFGANWNLTSITENGFGNVGNASALNVKVSVADPDVVWAGVAMTESNFYSLFLSQDNGQSFSKVSSYAPGNGHNFFISGMAASPTNPNRAYALFSAAGAAKIIRTNDLGQTWADISGFESGIDIGFPDVAVHCLVEMPYDETILWAGTDIGIFESTDSGASWALRSDLIPVAVYDMKVVNDQVVIATHGRGIWSATIAELSGYEPPAYFAPPTIVSVNQESISNTNAVITYQVASNDIDRVKIFVDGVEVQEVTQNFTTGVDYTYVYSHPSEGTFEYGANAFDDDTARESIRATTTAEIIDFNAPVAGIDITTFATADVSGTDFLINNLSGAISADALNNEDHPYSNNRTYTTVLKTPLIINTTDNDLIYEDFAITEVGFDFVFIEGSTDLQTWTVLDTYDATRFPDWQAEDTTIQGGGTANITDALFKEQSIDLGTTFSQGDNVVIRLRLTTDPAVISYGWAIRSLKFNQSVFSVNENTLSDGINIYPTMSNGNFTITSKNMAEDMEMKIFDLGGKTVSDQTLEFSRATSANVSVNLNSGVYIVQLVSPEGSRFTRKIVIK